MPQLILKISEGKKLLKIHN